MMVHQPRPAVPEELEALIGVEKRWATMVFFFSLKFGFLLGGLVFMEELWYLGRNGVSFWVRGLLWALLMETYSLV
jgi:hypothetical protein